MFRTLKQLGELSEVELENAKSYPPYNNHHEAYAILKEEIEEAEEELDIIKRCLDSYWQGVKSDYIDTELFDYIYTHALALSNEALQVSAVVLKIKENFNLEE